MGEGKAEGGDGREKGRGRGWERERQREGMGEGKAEGGMGERKAEGGWERERQREGMGERKAEGGDGDVERIRIIKKIDDKTDKEKRDKGLKAPKAQNKRWRHRHTKLEHCIPPAPPPPPLLTWLCDMVKPERFTVQ